MVFHGFWLVSMVFQGSFMVFHGFWLVSMVFQVGFMVSAWFPWFFKVVSWFFMVFDWFPWSTQKENTKDFQNCARQCAQTMPDELMVQKSKHLKGQL